MKAAFTIATANYLAQAKTVADSFLLHNSNFTFYIVLIDKKEGIDLSFFGAVQVIEVEQIGITFLQEMIDRYSVFELSNALKPFCAAYFLQSIPHIQAVLYFDSDIIVYDQLAAVNEMLDSASIIITPHATHPLPFDGLSIRENDFLNTGVYNAGFFALSNTVATFRFLDWWKERLRTHCLIDLANGLFVDQIWLNLVPLYFQDVKIFVNAGYNAAFWNMHERTIRQVATGRYMVNEDQPLVFFHFSGFDIQNPEIVSKYQRRITFEARPDIRPLYDNYIDTVKSNGYDLFSPLGCSYYIDKENRIRKAQEELLEAERARAEAMKPPPPSLMQKVVHRCKLTLRVFLKGY